MIVGIQDENLKPRCSRGSYVRMSQQNQHAANLRLGMQATTPDPHKKPSHALVLSGPSMSGKAVGRPTNSDRCQLSDLALLFWLSAILFRLQQGAHIRPGKHLGNCYQPKWRGNSWGLSSNAGTEWVFEGTLCKCVTSNCQSHP
jgi:hypothetical protein